jgi:hypothetical protein
MPYLIDPEQIYPRRLGLYRGALVVEYYNIDKDTIKKHLIQFDNDSLESVDKIVENMLKNPKHSVFLRKVQPNDIKKVLSGRFSNILP